jgi:uncharacterized RDD family membrane protein YckC
VQSTGRLRIDTPEQIALELPIAGIGSRSLAIAIDTVLQVVLFLASLLALGFVGRGMSLGLGGLRLTRFLEPYGPAVIVLFLFGLYWGYFAFFEIIWKGQTPGKRAVRIRVIKESGRPINAYEAIGRNLVRVIDLLPGMYAVGITCMMLNRHSQRLGDYVAGTVVVHDARSDVAQPDWSGEGNASNPDVAQLTSGDLVLIETYLQRRLELEPEVRDRTAHQIASRIVAKTGATRAPGQHIDDFLGEVARRVRDTARFRP